LVSLLRRQQGAKNAPSGGGGGIGVAVSGTVSDVESTGSETVGAGSQATVLNKHPLASIQAADLSGQRVP